jgi:N-acetylglucosaminyldiphosphoundecaprenol N-acetyl-beta-D-mannosaminyltransferase
MTDSSRRTHDVIGTPIDALNWDEAVQRIAAWSRDRVGRVVCICNVHSVVTAKQDAEFASAVRAADMATPDGAPIAWMLRWLGEKSQPRINGPDLMLKFCDHAAATGASVFLYGGTQQTLSLLVERLRKDFPGLEVAGSYSPPFRTLTAAEDEAIVDVINRSGAGVVWVGLGCPKQEKWMISHRGRIKAVMIGVGAAFDYHAGTITRAPSWMQRSGLEWLHRLLSEPRRLWRRYLITNTLFIWYAFNQLIFAPRGLKADFRK